MLLSNVAADLSTVPGGLFVSFAALREGHVRQVPGRHAGVVELEGTPEMVLEVVSDSSVEKDTVRLPELYRRAGIPEFWRVDARGELRFEVLRLPLSRCRKPLTRKDLRRRFSNAGYSGVSLSFSWMRKY